MNRNWRGRFVLLVALCLTFGIAAKAQNSYPTMHVSASPNPTTVNHAVTVTVSFTCCIEDYGGHMSCNVYNNATGKQVTTLNISPYGGSANWTPTVSDGYTVDCQWNGLIEYYGAVISYSLGGSTTFSVVT